MVSPMAITAARTISYPKSQVFLLNFSNKTAVRKCYFKGSEKLRFCEKKRKFLVSAISAFVNAKKMKKS